MPGHTLTFVLSDRWEIELRVARFELPQLGYNDRAEDVPVAVRHPPARQGFADEFALPARFNGIDPAVKLASIILGCDAPLLAATLENAYSPARNEGEWRAVGLDGEFPIEAVVDVVGAF